MSWEIETRGRWQKEENVNNEYEKLEVEIIEFESEDVIVTSGNFGDEDDID